MLGSKYLKIDSTPVVIEPRLGNTDILTTLESVERATYVVDSDYDKKITALEAAYGVVEGVVLKVSDKLFMLKNNECTAEELTLIQLSMHLACETLETLGVESKELNLPAFEHNYDSKLLASSITYEGVSDFITRMFEILGRLLEVIFGKRRSVSAAISSVIQKELVLKKIDISKAEDIKLIIKKEELATLYYVYYGVISFNGKNILESIFLSAINTATAGAKYIKALPEYYKKLDAALKKAIDNMATGFSLDVIELPEVADAAYQAILKSETTRLSTTDSAIKKYTQDNNLGTLQRILLISNNIFAVCSKTDGNATSINYVTNPTLDNLEKLPKDVLAGEPDTYEISSKLLADYLNKLIDAIKLIDDVYKATNYEKVILDLVKPLEDYVKSKITNQQSANMVLTLTKGTFENKYGNPNNMFTVEALTVKSGLKNLANATHLLYTKKIEEHNKNNTPQQAV